MMYRVAEAADLTALSEMRWEWRANEDRGAAVVSKDEFVEACTEARYLRSDDTNGFQQEGFGVMDQTIHQGRRWSTAVGYLNPVKDRENLTIRVTGTPRRDELVQIPINEQLIVELYSR